MRRRINITLGLILVLLLVQIQACTDASLAKVQKLVLEASQGNDLVASTARGLADAQPPVVSAEDIVPVLQATNKVAQIGKRADAILLRINALDPASKAQLLAVANEISQEVDGELVASILSIKNEAARTTLNGVVASFRVALTTLKIGLQNAKTKGGTP